MIDVPKDVDIIYNEIMDHLQEKYTDKPNGFVLCAVLATALSLLDSAVAGRQWSGNVSYRRPEPEADLLYSIDVIKGLLRKILELQSQRAEAA